MKLIIDIPEEKYKTIQEGMYCGILDADLYGDIKNGIPQPCGDAISRQAVLDIVDGYSVSQSNVEDVTQDIISDIMVLSPVNPQEPSEDAVSRGVFEQVMWERDVAIEQLEELGYSLGEKPKTDVLDKIRAEILLRDKNVKDVRTDGRCFFTADEIFEIIDKYISGEPQESEEISDCKMAHHF